MQIAKRLLVPLLFHRGQTVLLRKLGQPLRIDPARLHGNGLYEFRCGVSVTLVGQDHA